MSEQTWPSCISPHEISALAPESIFPQPPCISETHQGSAFTLIGPFFAPFLAFWQNIDITSYLPSLYVGTHGNLWFSSALSLPEKRNMVQSQAVMSRAASHLACVACKTWLVCLLQVAWLLHLAWFVWRVVQLWLVWFVFGLSYSLACLFVHFTNLNIRQTGEEEKKKVCYFQLEMAGMKKN